MHIYIYHAYIYIIYIFIYIIHIYHLYIYHIYITFLFSSEYDSRLSLQLTLPATQTSSNTLPTLISYSSNRPGCFDLTACIVNVRENTKANS